MSKLTDEILGRMSPAQRRAYETSLRESRRAAALAYKLLGGRLNDPPRRAAKRGNEPHSKTAWMDKTTARR